MNNKYNVKSLINGLFLVSGKGFVASLQTNASAFDNVGAAQQVTCAGNMGISAISVRVPQVKSYAVNYIRTGDVNKDGSISANRRNPSKRRFATKDEAVQHGSRFGERRAKAGDKEGTAGHIGYWVNESFDAVNASINWKTGLTNSI